MESGEEMALRRKYPQCQQKNNSHLCLHLFAVLNYGFAQIFHNIRLHHQDISPYSIENIIVNMIAEIAKDGDLVLSIGPEKVKVLVHSLFLKTASKPFSAMLSPRWKEGLAKLTQDGDPLDVITLPEDDVEGLLPIFAIVHHRSDLIASAIGADVVLKVAVMADKYDFIEVVKFACETWPQPRQPKKDIFLVAAAYLLGNIQSFKELTKALILNYGGTFLDLSSEQVECTIGWKIICTYFHRYRTTTERIILDLLEEHRNKAMLKFAEIILAETRNGSGMCVHKCD